MEMTKLARFALVLQTMLRCWCKQLSWHLWWLNVLKKFIQVHHRFTAWLIISASAAQGTGVVSVLFNRPMNWAPTVIIATILGGDFVIDYIRHKNNKGR